MTRSRQQPLASFTSHIAGRNAKVTIWADRVEWVRPGRMAIANGLLLFLAVCTVGLSLLARSCRPRFAPRDRKMLAMRSIQSVSTRRRSLHTVVTLAAGAASIDLRVSHQEAARIEDLMRQLILGSAPTGQPYPGAGQPRW